MKALDSVKSNYPSEIPIKLIIECADLLSIPLTAIFNQCFIAGVFPCIFKQAYVTQIPKCKAPKDITDFENSSSLKSILHSYSNLKRFGTSTEVLKSVYCSYVRPSLEYACPAWHPRLTEDQTDRL